MTDIYEKIPLTSQRTIRILILEPTSETNAPLIGKLEIASLDSEPEYEALSYTWGPRDPQKYILCNDQILGITQNCHEALVTLRHQTRQRRIWVDAICINQESVIEKNHQVPLMISVYESASMVVVWLGPGDEHSGVVSRLIRQLSSEIQLGFQDGDVSTDPITYEETETVKEAASLAVSMCLPYRSPYFSRVWTVQEIAVAHKIIVMYGHCSIPWWDFVLAWRIVGDLYVASHSELLSNTLQLATHFVIPSPDELRSCLNVPSGKSICDSMDGQTAWSVMAGSKRLNASDPRDRVYGFLWATQRAGIASPEVDYSKSVEVVFTDYMLSLLATHQYSVALYHVDTAGYLHLPHLPSWVIDFTYRGEAAVLHLQHELIMYTSSGRYQPLSFDFSERRLRVEGLSIDTVKATAPLGDRSGENDHWTIMLPKVMEVWQEGFAHLDLYTNNQTDWSQILTLVFMAVYPDHTKISYCPPPPASSRSTAGVSETALVEFKILVSILTISFRFEEDARTVFFTILHHYLSKDDFEKAFRKICDNPVKFLCDCDSLFPTNIDKSHKAYEIAKLLVYGDYLLPFSLSGALKRLYHKCSHLSMFMTSDRRCGTSAHTPAPRDEVVIFRGGPSPFILRPLGNDQWRFLGPTYVAGVMYGEAWPGNDHPSLRKFEII